MAIPLEYNGIVPGSRVGEMETDFALKIRSLLLFKTLFPANFNVELLKLPFDTYLTCLLV